MRIVDRVVYLGANLYAHYPVIRLRLALGALEEWPTGRLGPAFVDRLIDALPGLATHGCSYRAPGGFIRRLREGDGTWLGHVLEHVALELQQLAGSSVTFGKTRSTGRPGEYDVVYEYEDADVGVRSGEIAERFLSSLLPPTVASGAPPCDLAAEVAELVALAAPTEAAADPAAGGGDVRTIIIASERDTDEVAGLLAARLGGDGRRVAVAGSFGARLGDVVLAGPAEAGAAAERVMLESGVDVAVTATTRRRLRETGLGSRRCDVAAVIGSIDGEDDPLHIPLEIADRTAVLPGDPPAAVAAATIAALVERR